jgi:hypothetical protein
MPGGHLFIIINVLFLKKKPRSMAGAGAED